MGLSASPGCLCTSGVEQLAQQGLCSIGIQGNSKNSRSLSNLQHFPFSLFTVAVFPQLIDSCRLGCDASLWHWSPRPRVVLEGPWDEPLKPL